MADYTPGTFLLKDGLTLTIRSAAVSDAEALLQCMYRYIEDGAGQIWSSEECQLSLDEEKSWIRGLVEHPCELLLVAEINGAIVGNIDFHNGRRKRIAHSGEFGMSILPEWRGRGIGEILLKELIAWGREHEEIERINLRVLSNNFPAVSLYKKLGFQMDGVKPSAVKYDSSSYADEIHMGLSVAS